MLLHLPLLILAIGLATGIFFLANLSQSGGSIDPYRSRINAFRNFVIFLNLSILIRILQYYFAENLSIPIQNYGSDLLYGSIVIPEVSILVFYYFQIHAIAYFINPVREPLLQIYRWFRFRFLLLFLLIHGVCLIFSSILIEYLRILLRYSFLPYAFGVILFLFYLRRMRIPAADRWLTGIRVLITIQLFGLSMIRLTLGIADIHGKQFFYLLLPTYYLSANLYWFYHFRRQIKGALIKEKTDQDNESRLMRFAKVYRLSDREQGVARLLSSGQSNRQIADQLYISIQTVKFHIGNIYHKVGVQSRGQFFNKLIDQP